MLIKSPQTECEWEQYFHLRWLILRAPWHKDITTVKDEMEDLNHVFHAAAWDQEKVIGVGRLTVFENLSAQVRYMAVAQQYQRTGAGKAILEYLEEKARQNKVEKIFLQARENALPFYQNQGYRVQEKTFLLFNTIQHFLMTKEL